MKESRSKLKADAEVCDEESSIPESFFPNDDFHQHGLLCSHNAAFIAECYSARVSRR